MWTMADLERYVGMGAEELREALDVWLFEGRTLREWNEILLGMRAPVIRCSECSFFEKRSAPEGFGWCLRPGAGCGQNGEFFCAGAVRKETK